MKVLRILIITAFVSWWSLNLFFNLPENSVPIVLNYDLYKKWDNLFYQRWSFFAPPPDFNSRMYYLYTDLEDSSKMIMYEVFETLNKKRREQYPLDDDLANLDFILHNVANPITRQLGENYNFYKLDNGCDSLDPDSDCYYKYLEERRSDFNTSASMSTLIKHAKIIANQQEMTNSRVQIIFGGEKLPRFKDRSNEEAEREQFFLFKSNYYNLKTNQWEKFQG